MECTLAETGDKTCVSSQVHKFIQNFYHFINISIRSVHIVGNTPEHPSVQNKVTNTIILNISFYDTLEIQYLVHLSQVAAVNHLWGSSLVSILIERFLIVSIIEYLSIFH